MIARTDIAQIVRGILMGGADIIPGVSGGTVALILGIYERLVTAISRFDRAFIGHLRAGRWSQAAAHVDLRFLATLGTGIAVGIGGLASLMHFLLESPAYRPPTLALFFGLILASSVLVGRMIDRWSFPPLLAAVAATVFAYWLVGLMPAVPSDGYGYLFLCSVVAICAMILPGISGAFILLLLGKYADVTGALRSILGGAIGGEALLTLGVFAAGAVTGLLAFSKFLRWLLARHHAVTMAALCGFMLGSLRKIWPYKFDLTPEVSDLNRKRFENVWPDQWSGPEWLSLAMIVLGFVMVLGLDWITIRQAPRRSAAPGPAGEPPSAAPREREQSRV